MSLRKKGRTSFKFNASTVKEKGITLLSILKTQKRVKKLVLILATSTSITIIREKAAKIVQIIETTEAGRDD